MELVNKAAANAMATPATAVTKTSLEIIEAMQVNIQTTLRGGSEMSEKVKMSLTGNMFAMNEGQVTEEAQKEHRENFTNTVVEAVNTVGDISTAALMGSSTSGNSNIIEETLLSVPGIQQNAPHFLVKAFFEFDGTARASRKEIEKHLMSFVVTEENKTELTREMDKLAKEIFITTKLTQFEYEGSKIVHEDSEKKIFIKSFMKGLKAKEGDIVTEERFKAGTVSEFIEVSVLYSEKDKKDKKFTVKAPYLKAVTFEQLVHLIEKKAIAGQSAHLKKCYKNLKKEHKSFLREISGESAELSYAADDKGNFYGANVKKLVNGEWILQNTTSFLEELRTKIIVFIAENSTEDTDITPLLFVKELNQPQAVFVEEGPTEKERVTLYNKTIFNFSGKLEDLTNSSREAITKLLSVSLVSDDYINNMLHDRAEAAIAFKNDSAPMGGTGATGVEFNQGIISNWLDKNVWNLLWSSKITRALNTTNGSLNTRYEAAILDDQIIPVFFAKTIKIGRWSLALDMGLANFKTFLALAPDYIFNKVSGSITKEEAIALKVSLDTLKLMMVSEDIEITPTEKSTGAFVEIYNLFVKKFGSFIFTVRNGEGKAENAANLIEHEARLNYLKTGVYVQPTDKEQETAVINNKDKQLNTTEVKLRVGKKEVVIELAYGLMRTGVHYKKDIWNIVGKSAIGAKTATHQNYITTLCNGEGTVEENEYTFVRENVKDVRILKQILAAGNMDLVRGGFELAKTEEIKLYVPANAEMNKYLKKILITYKDSVTENELEANYIWGDKNLSNCNGIVLKGDRFYKFTENKDGNSVRFIMKENSDFLLSFEKVQELYEEHEYLTPEKMYVLRDLLLDLIDEKKTLTDTSADIFRVLEGTRAIALTKDQYFPYYPSSKTITTAAIPTELTQALVVWSAVASAGGDLKEVLAFELEGFIEKVKTDKLFQLKMKENFDIAKKGKNLFELDGMTYKVKTDFINRMVSTQRVIYRPMLEMRKALLTKKAYEYLFEKKVRFNLVALTHSGNPFVNYVNQKTFNLMIKWGVLAEHEGKMYGSNTRFPETYLSGLTFRYKVWNRVPDNCICMADVALALHMGDSDSDQITVKRPYNFSLDTEIHRELARCTKPFRAFYNKMQEEVLDSPAAAYKKYERVFRLFKEDHRAAFAELRTGVLLNEGTDAKTGLVVAWETRMTLLLFLAGADKETIKKFKFIVGGFLSQITIASKNADVEALLDFNKNWETFAKGTTDIEEIQAIFNLVEYKFI